MSADPKNDTASEPTSDEEQADAMEKVQEEAADERKEGGYQDRRACRLNGSALTRASTVGGHLPKD